MAVNIPGLVAIAVFYMAILAFGIFIGRRKNKTGTADELFLANRSFGLVVASLTTAASMVGGGYVNGTAEVIGRDGMLWTIGPIGYNIGMALGGIFIAPKVRAARFTTIVDPFQKKYGPKMGGLLFISEFFGDVFWEAAIFGALGTTLSIVLDINITVSVVISACVAVIYTLFGGLYSVAYTDIVQLLLIVVGLVLAVPFVLASPAVDMSKVTTSWTGHVKTQHIGLYIDTIFLCVCGGVPWQAWYQRILACKSPALAQISTVVGAGIALLLAIPPGILGVAGAATDWNATTYEGSLPLTFDEWTNILPMTLHYLCPQAVSIIGIGAVSAAVMSSADSCVLASGTIFASNIYRNIFRPNAPQREIVWVLRLSIVLVGALGAIIALTVGTVYGLFILCGDLMFVVQFPQLICVLWVSFANSYGSLAGFLIAMFLRFTGGEPYLSIPPLIRYPYYDEKHGQMFPFKTMAMCISFAIIIGVSYLTNRLFRNGTISEKFDILQCFTEKEYTMDESKENGDNLQSCVEPSANDELLEKKTTTFI
ncbi:high-affinity choline transporter 1-like [Mizuhopecten yessoensis]|uniref:high-affinity choline transporter 1-like n=1 Tax=Mizuhopecten yessoensis TaxID=6573 RepID=UPI000B45DF68|nr:high-affinity choline transporter 1-like [Mizuhopecten yessoensis]XP_021349964.1 high-affinity choline transporter 1-like [Mizuhopecten yessoensis]XP_021349965.1 high-affinity choline transporter 1-like [Mizuhopecten yessoensis]